MAIPKIIHQTYKTSDIPEPLSDYRTKLLSLHPDWEYRFYDDSGCREIIERNLPYFIPLYDSYALDQGFWDFKPPPYKLEDRIQNEMPGAIHS